MNPAYTEYELKEMCSRGPADGDLGRSPALAETALIGVELLWLLMAGNEDEIQKARQALLDNALAQARYQGMKQAMHGSMEVCVTATEGDEMRCLLGASCTNAIPGRGRTYQWVKLSKDGLGAKLMRLHDNDRRVRNPIKERDLKAVAKAYGLVYTDPETAAKQGYPTAPIGSGS